eukprot:2203228-Amphidinium_carterae.1
MSYILASVMVPFDPTHAQATLTAPNPKKPRGSYKNKPKVGSSDGLQKTYSNNKINHHSQSHNSIALTKMFTNVSTD